MIKDILDKAVQLRIDYLDKNNIEAFRLYDRESDKLTEVTVDIFADWALISVWAKIPDKKLFQVIEYCVKNVEAKGVYIKDRSKDGLADLETGPVWGEAPPKDFYVTEKDAKYLIQLDGNLDPGVFLDSRIIRKLAHNYGKRNRVLNLFSYTATASLQALAGGADEVINVDISNTYQNVAKRNYELNGRKIDKSHFVTQDVMSFLKSEKGRSDKYGLIIIDPPTFSRSKKGDFTVMKNHVQLINDALFALTQNGKIIFTTHYKDFRLAKRQIKGKIKEMTEKTNPIDFARGKAHKSYIISHSPRWSN